MGIHEDWQQVEHWLAVHAVGVLARLPSGASESALIEAEEEIGFALPRELRASLAVHDGNDGAFWLHEDNLGALMSLGDIVETWQTLVESV